MEWRHKKTSRYEFISHLERRSTKRESVLSCNLLSLRSKWHRISFFLFLFDILCENWWTHLLMRTISSISQPSIRSWMNEWYHDKTTIEMMSTCVSHFHFPYIALYSSREWLKVSIFSSNDNSFPQEVDWNGDFNWCRMSPGQTSFLPSPLHSCVFVRIWRRISP